MPTLFSRPTRLAAMTALLAGAFLLLPVKSDPINPLGYAIASAAGNGGDHGGMRDQGQSTNSNTGYTGYSADTTDPVTPCQSCYGGSGPDAQNLGGYTYGTPGPCLSCANGATGK
jgi:hypothetical protein